MVDNDPEQPILGKTTVYLPKTYINQRDRQMVNKSGVILGSYTEGLDVMLNFKKVVLFLHFFYYNYYLERDKIMGSVNLKTYLPGVWNYLLKSSRQVIVHFT